MIYRKNNKILVPTSGGGLCKTCCPAGCPDYAVVAAMDEVGTFRFGTNCSSTGRFYYNTCRAVTIDGEENVYCCSGSTVRKYDCFSNLIWTKTPASNIYGIAVDADQNVYLAGYRSDSKTVWKLDSDGNTIWSYDTGASSNGIAVDGDGYVYVAGTRSSSLSVWKLDNEGNLVDSYDTGGTTWAVTFNSAGKIYVSGTLASSKSVWQLASDFSLDWSAEASYYSYAIDVDSSGNVYVAGASYHPVHKFNSSGTEQWAYNTGAPCYAIAIDLEGYIWVGGEVDEDNNWEFLWRLDGDGNLDCYCSGQGWGTVGGLHAL